MCCAWVNALGCLSSEGQMVPREKCPKSAGHSCCEELHLMAVPKCGAVCWSFQGRCAVVKCSFLEQQANSHQAETVQREICTIDLLHLFVVFAAPALVAGVWASVHAWKWLWCIYDAALLRSSCSLIIYILLQLRRGVQERECLNVGMLSSVRH